jgi:uncharacterized protein YabE (DUF348 family)/3D (Asp-Asp-Asp) domain-containing protein
MGDVVVQDTHGKRSSSMSYALRWKRENFKWILSSSILAVSITLLFLLLMYGTSIKNIYIVVDGQEQKIETRQWVVQELLEEQSIELGEHDRISAPVNASIKNGDRIIIDRAIPVLVSADGETVNGYTIGRTVSAALQELNITLNPEDKVTPAPDAVLDGQTTIQVVRVNKVVEEVSEPVPFEVIKQNDPKLVKGKEQVVQEGQEGTLVKKIEKVFEDGVLVSEQVVEKSVAAESVSKIVAVGTKNPVVVLSASSPNVDTVTKGGVTFGYKQILNNVTLTAYTAGVESTGKSEEHPQFGMTYSGTRVTEGRTIAVDPKVIPIGWWVYIEGIGFRRAEDIGSGVKGNMIDVYYENEDYAKRFGMKRGYKVYIVGKEKPAAN